MPTQKRTNDLNVTNHAYLTIFKTNYKPRDYPLIPLENKETGPSKDETFIYQTGEPLGETLIEDIGIQPTCSKDYADISGDISLELPPEYFKNKHIYNGVKVKINLVKKQGEKIISSYEQLGFIRQNSLNGGKLKLDITNYEHLLERKDTIDLTDKRSQIIKKIVEKSGMKCEINVKGLEDKVITYRNYNTSGESVNLPKGKWTDKTSTLELSCKTIGSNYNTLHNFVPPQNCYQNISNENREYYKDCNGKAQDEILRKLRKLSRRKYAFYRDNRDSDADVTYKHLKKGIGANCCDWARMVKACLDSAGHPCIIIHGTEHYLNMVKKGNSWLTFDLTTTRNGKTNYGVGRNQYGI